MRTQHRSAFRTWLRPRWRRSGSGAAAALLLLTACSSSATHAGSTPPGTAGAASVGRCIAKANEFVKPYRTFPTKLPAGFSPLPERPPTGKTVIQMANGTIPSDAITQSALKQAAGLIGWRSKVINFNGTVEDLNSKIEQGISEHPAMIVVGGWPPDAIQQPLADAKKHGVIVVLASVPDDATDSAGFAASIQGKDTFARLGQVQAYLFLQHSHCEGNVAVFSLPFPVLKIGTDSFMKTVRDNCRSCKVTYNEIQSKAIGTPAAPSAVVTKLQSDPSTKYVFVSIANIATGLDSALTQAGISGVNVFGDLPDENAIKALRDGASGWWTARSSLMTGWNALDAGLRVLETGKPFNDTGRAPYAVLTRSNVPDAAQVPTYPTDYVQEFAAAWHVS